MRSIVVGIRIAGLILAAGLLYWSAKHSTPAADDIQTLNQVRQVFPTAARLATSHPNDPSPRAIYDSQGKLLGYFVETSPASDHLIGYSGPSNVLIGISPDRRIQTVVLLGSRDTPEHVEQMRGDARFWEQFPGKGIDTPPEKIEGVSGSTLTSLAVAEGIWQRLAGKSPSFRFPDPLTLSEVQLAFPTATALLEDPSMVGWHQVVDAKGKELGFALRSSPEGDNTIGYSGPTEIWAAIHSDRETLLGLFVRHSYDTPEYVERVRDDEQYLQSLTKYSLTQWQSLDFTQEGIEGVSGATQTSFGIAAGWQKRVQAIRAEGTDPFFRAGFFHLRDVAILLLLVGALALSFGRWKGVHWLRRTWQILLVGGYGLYLGDLLSLALLNGWSKNGLPWQTAPGLVALVAVALLTPALSRHQIYCHHLCPHGALQEWLGRFRFLHITLPSRLNQTLLMLPYLLLGLAFILSVVSVSIDLAAWEPFDAWSLKASAAVSTLIAVVGLIASCFSPMAYCRFGCPTGALLKLTRGHTRERPDGKEIGALVILAAATLFVAYSQFSNFSWGTDLPNGIGLTKISGSAFGTTWSVQFKGPIEPALQEEMAAELNRIEQTLSHWKPSSETSAFNSSGTTQALEFSSEFIGLVAMGIELSEKTDGAFDLTLGPLLDAYGLGPAGPVDREPTDEELADILKRCGWRQLEVDTDDHTLRKKVPSLQIDLGALLQGYAAERLRTLLRERGHREFLIDVGGELQAEGSWTVAVENPEDAAKPLRTFRLHDRALATSGVYRQTKHILDAKTGQPVNAHWQLVAVILPSATDADAWATALLAAGEKAVTLAQQNNIPALFVDQEGNQVLSPAAESFFSATSEK